jgi:hypothetical protein
MLSERVERCTISITRDCATSTSCEPIQAQVLGGPLDGLELTSELALLET